MTMEESPLARNGRKLTLILHLRGFYGHYPDSSVNAVPFRDRFKYGKGILLHGVYYQCAMTLGHKLVSHHKLALHDS